MKGLLCLILLCNVCICLGDSEETGNYSREIVKDEHYGHQSDKNIERPCSLHDVDCIRSYFAHNSGCTPVYGPVPDPYKIKTLPMYLAHINLTFTMNDLEIRGFNDWKIKEFYINKESDRLVLEVEFNSLILFTPAGILTYHQKGKEPLELSDYSYIDYRSLSLTMTIPHIRDIQLSKANVYAYITDAAPKYGLGPAYTESKVPLVTAVNSRMLDNIGLSLQEAFITQGPVYMSVFVQGTICDFNL